jgi:preprotein translocase subunit SecY
MNEKLKGFLSNLPSLPVPERKLTVKEKLEWSGIALLFFFVMSYIPLIGVSPSYSFGFQVLQTLIAAHFGSLLSLGIGPIVTAAIFIELLQGAEIIHFDLSTREGRVLFQGTQKLLAFIFIVVENFVYVFSGAIPPAYPSIFLQFVMWIQLVVAGIILLFLDELVSKWGVGSGISLFIMGGLSLQLLNTLFNPLFSPPGAIPAIIYSISSGIPQAAMIPLIEIVVTFGLFAFAIWLQQVRIEIPLSFGRIRGFSIKWPISLLYNSIIPLVMVVSIVAGLEFMGLTLYKAGNPILGNFTAEQTPLGVQELPTSGFLALLNPPSLLQLFTEPFKVSYAYSMIFYFLFFVVVTAIFSYLWLEIGGQDPNTLAEQLLATGLMMPGFRADKRIVADTLRRYMVPLSILGGAITGFVAALAALFNALIPGIGILLIVMIGYQFYNYLLSENPYEMRPIKDKIINFKL